MQYITYNVLYKSVESTMVHDGDDLTTTLIFDYTGTNYEAWNKFVDFVIPNGTTSFKSLGNAIIVNYILTNAELKTGTLVFQPYAKLGTGATIKFEPFPLKVFDSLNVEVDTSLITQDIIDYINQQLANKVDKVSGKSLILDTEATRLANGTFLTFTDQMEVLT